MFDQAFENLRKATETTVQMQQELFKKWITLWPGTPPAPPSPGPEFQQFRAKWAEVVTELLKKQQEAFAVRFKAGVENIEKAFHVGQARTPEELRAQLLELWKQCFESFGRAYEAQLQDFQAAMEKWSELLTPVR